MPVQYSLNFNRCSANVAGTIPPASSPLKPDASEISNPVLLPTREFRLLEFEFERLPRLQLARACTCAAMVVVSRACAHTACVLVSGVAREEHADCAVVCYVGAALSRESPTADGWRHSAGCYRCLRTSLAISGCLSAASN